MIRLIINFSIILAIAIKIVNTHAFAEESQDDSLNFNGMIESRLGARVYNDPVEKDLSIGEFRLQLETEKDFDDFTFNLVTDFIFDPVMDDYSVDLNSGFGSIDLRQMNVEFSPNDIIDVKLGRQVLTWGTGDLVFINDLFAKDWNSFLIGRDVEYLKAPTDAIKSSIFFDEFSLDIVYVPKFGADRYIDGQRLSYFDANSDSLAGRNAPLQVMQPNSWFDDDELALRVYRSFGAYETALYFYQGFWKSPAGQDSNTGKALFPQLDVYGASIRGPVAGGIANIEVGYYKSEQAAAKKPTLSNSEFRLLIGFEREIATELTLSLQYNLERKLDYDDYLNSLPYGAIRDDEDRQQVTVRLTKLLMQQDLKLSLFNFYSPTDDDGFLRMNISYKLSDATKVEWGANLFYGDHDYTFYGQFKNNSNIFAAIRYEF